MKKLIAFLMVICMMASLAACGGSQKAPQGQKVEGDKAQITYTSVLNANAYGARGTYRMKGTHHYEKRNGAWIAVNR